MGERLFFEFKTTSFDAPPPPGKKEYHGPTINGMQFITFENHYPNTLYFIYSTYSKKWFVFRPQDVRGAIESINYVYELDVNLETLRILRQRLPEVPRVIHRRKSKNLKASNLNYLCIDITKIKQNNEWIARLKPLD